MIKNILFILVLFGLLQGENLQSVALKDKNLQKNLQTKQIQRESMSNNAISLKYIEVKDVKIPLIYESSSMLPIGFVGLIFNGGGYVNETKTSLSSFSADILERGSKKRGEIGFANELESNAINLSVSNGIENLKFSIEFLKEKEDKALELLEELLSDPNLSKEALKQTKLNLTSYILSNENNFDYIAGRNLNKLIFSGTPLENGSLGDIVSIEDIDLDNVEDYIKNTFILDNVVLIVGGDIDIQKLEPKLISILKKLPNGKKYQNKKYYPISTPKSEDVKLDTKQAFIYFASPFNFEDYESSLHKAQVMSFILGGSGFGSRIMEEVRVKRGLAYSAYAYNVINNTTSYTSGYLQTKLENKDEAIKVVKQVIANFVKNGVTQKELDDAKAYILGSRVLSQETLSQRINQKYINFTRNLPLNYDEILAQKIKKLSLGELNSYIKSHSEILNLSFSIVSNE
ncbi:MAG: insulinase family protein [Helicobacteraceae bacterium]|nr:insulinase family protein [Helicobacteraceae bacterium]